MRLNEEEVPKCHFETKSLYGLPIGLFRNIDKWEFKDGQCFYIGWESPGIGK